MEKIRVVFVKQFKNTTTPRPLFKAVSFLSEKEVQICRGLTKIIIILI